MWNQIIMYLDNFWNQCSVSNFLERVLIKFDNLARLYKIYGHPAISQQFRSPHFISLSKIRQCDDVWVETFDLWNSRNQICEINWQVLRIWWNQYKKTNTKRISIPSQKPEYLLISAENSSARELYTREIFKILDGRTM